MDSESDSDDKSIHNESDVVEELGEKEEIATREKRKRPISQSPNVPVTSKKMKHGLYKPPTPEELNDLKEAETMYHSSLFRLQVDELMSELKKKTKHKVKLQNWLESLKEFLTEIPNSEVYELSNLSWLKKRIKVPLIRHPAIKKGMFRFLPPSDVFPVGSYVMDTMCTPESVVDVAVEIPKSCWQKMDFLNHTYHRKRALYLAYLAQSLMDCDLIESMKYCYKDDCHLKPVLVLYPKALLGKHFTIHLLPFPEKGAFKLSRFIPQRNNVRKSWFYNSSDDETAVPTPYYNSTVLSDILIPSTQEFLKKYISAQSVKDGIILLKVWCIQRGIYGGNTAVNGFIISMLIAYLLEKQKISHLMSSYQVFRNTLLALKRENWYERGVTLCPKSADSQPYLEEFQQNFAVTFVENSGFLNICYSMSKQSFLRLQHEAELALGILDSSSSDNFGLLFMNKMSFCRKFEWLFRLSNVQKYEEYCQKLNADDVVLDHVGDLVSSIIPKISALLRKGLGSRVVILDYDIPMLPSWSICEKAPNPNSKQIVFGIIQNQEFVFTNLEKGPPADSPEAREFRSFWQVKSELRRFKDGSIHEAVVWHSKTLEEKRRVLQEIVKCVLEMHAGIAPTDIVSTGSDIDATLHIPLDLMSQDFPVYGTGEEFFVTLMQAFSNLTSHLRKLDGMPLGISSVQGISPALRFTEVFPPIPRALVFSKKACDIQNDLVLIAENPKKAPTWVAPLEVIIHLEGSGKWPDDVEAIKRVKAAFHLKIAELLSDQFCLCTQPAPGFVDVLKDGFVFRLEVACHKEITLLKQVKTPEGMIKIQENKESRDLECRTEILPKVNSILHGIQQQHNTFGVACRFAKRWVSSQLLHGYINDVVIEMLVAYVYISPEPYTCPSSSQVAFLRFLELLHRHDWKMSPLIINFNSELKKPEIAEILSSVTSQRANLPPMLIVTPFDRQGCLWTKDSPTLLILKRLVSLSKAAIETFEKQLMEPKNTDFKQIFRPPLNPYDVTIHLKLKQVPKLCFALDEEKTVTFHPIRAYQKKRDEKMPVVDYDPVQYYLQELRACFSDFALFFYDTYGGRYISVVWKPDAFLAKPFKASRINGCQISGTNADGTVNIVPNVEGILDCFKKLGAGLVKKIEKHVEKWSIT